MTMLYPYLCYNEVCYKWTALYIHVTLVKIKLFWDDKEPVNFCISLQS